MTAKDIIVNPRYVKKLKQYCPVEISRVGQRFAVWLKKVAEDFILTNRKMCVLEDVPFTIGTFIISRLDY